MEPLGEAGNWFAGAAILAWPIVAIVLYQTRLTAEATVWTILGALLLLPTGFFIKFPMLPAIDKNSLPNVCALIGCILLLPRHKRSAFGFGLVEILEIMLIAGPLISSGLNYDAIAIGDRILPGVGLYDGISAFLGQFLIFLPFFIGRQVFRDSPEFETIIRCLVIAGLLYSLPMLLEIRISPQLSNWIYGYFPSSFSVEGRYGGFRPVVFMKNGLTAAFFMMTAFVGSLAISRVREELVDFPRWTASGYLGATIVLCKSGGALIYSIVGGLFVARTKPRAQLYFALVLVSIALLYPALRIVDIFPDKTLVDLASSIDQNRADSLKFRFDQERLLLDHASERLMFGWGRYGRNRVYAESGKDTSVTDGAWIQILGEFGLIGFLAQFGLLSFPVFRAHSAHKFIKTERERIFLAAVSLIVSLGLIEQLPNSSISPWSWLLAGALLGRAERIIERAATGHPPAHSRMTNADIAGRSPRPVSAGSRSKDKVV